MTKLRWTSVFTAKCAKHDVNLTGCPEFFEMGDVIALDPGTLRCPANPTCGMHEKDEDDWIIAFDA